MMAPQVDRRRSILQTNVFWKDVLESYCDVTHFHGFHELKAATTKWGKFFWLNAILSGFIFTFALIVLLCNDYLEEPVLTSVTHEKYGTVSIPALYCPADWIDASKQKRLNIEDRHMWYSLSYLRQQPFVYFDYPFLSFINAVRLNSSKSYCSSIDTREYKRLFSAIIGNYLDADNYTKYPHYFGEDAKQLIRYSKGSAVFFANAFESDPGIMKHFFNLYAERKQEEIFSVLYDNFTLRLPFTAYLKDALYQGNETEFEAGLKSIEECHPYTLRTIDSMKFGGIKECTDAESGFLSHAKFFDEDTFCMKLAQELAMFTLFSEANYYTIWQEDIWHVNGEGDPPIPRSLYPGERLARIRLEQHKKEQIRQLISLDGSYAKFLKSNQLNSNESTFIKFLTSEGNDIATQNFKLADLLENAEQLFWKNEEKDFMTMMKQLKFETVKDLWLNISIDESQLMLSLSVSPDAAVRPTEGDIKVSKVVASDGVCFRFLITANMKAVNNSLSSISAAMLEIQDKQQKASISAGVLGGKLKDKLFANIVLFHWTGKFFYRRPINYFVIGNETDDFQSSDYNTFEIGYTEDWYKTYYHFELSAITYQYSVNREDQAPCTEDEFNDNGIKNSFSNCVLYCYNKYSMPKIFWEPQEPTLSNCVYLTESMDGASTKDVCSIFAPKKRLFAKKSEDEDKLNSDFNKCVDDCSPACNSLSYTLRNSSLNCTSKSCQDYPDPEGQRKECDRLIENRYCWNLFENLPSNETDSDEKKPIWLSPYSKSTHRGIVDTINLYGGIQDVNRTRIEMEINVDITKYTEKFTFSWYGFLGVIGGQIGLVMSGSILTGAQMLWWCTNMFSKCFNASRTESSAIEENRYSFTNLDHYPKMMKLKRLMSQKSSMKIKPSNNNSLV